MKAYPTFAGALLLLSSAAAGAVLAEGSEIGCAAPPRATVLAAQPAPSRPSPAGRVLDPETARRGLAAFIEARIPGVEVPATAGEWKDGAEALRERFLRDVVYRGVPREWGTPEDSRARLGVQWGETLTRPGYSIRKIRYEAVPGFWVPALLYEPDGLTGRVPAVLNVNGHVGAPGKAIAYEQVRCINLAKRGILALHPEWLACGELSDARYRHNRLAYLDLCGRSGVSVFFQAMRRGIDVLEDHAHTDRKRIAMTGLSGGGWQTIWLSALDRRIAATAPNAGYIGLAPRVRNQGDIGDLEQNPADMLRTGDYTHLTAVLAPRPALLIYNERDDCCFQTARARPSVYEPIRPFYDLFQAADRFRFHNNVDPGTHNYDRDNREQFYRFINDVFAIAPRRDAEIPVDDEVLSFDALRVGVPSDNRGFGELAEALLANLPRNRAPQRPDAAWREKNRRRLRDLLKIASGEAPDAQVIQHTRLSHGGEHRRLLRIGGEWSVPVVEFYRDEPGRTVVLVSGSGREGLLNRIRQELRAGHRVLTVDLALCGEGYTGPAPRAQYAMMIGTVGERLLGVQVRQLLAVLRWASKEFGSERLILSAEDRTGSVIAACAAALGDAPVREVNLRGLPASLKTLIQSRVEYDDNPELFCFGLLHAFDVPDLLAMADVPVSREP